MMRSRRFRVLCVRQLSRKQKIEFEFSAPPRCPCTKSEALGDDQNRYRRTTRGRDQRSRRCAAAQSRDRASDFSRRDSLVESPRTVEALALAYLGLPF